jgi:hypothetical protein
MELNIVNPLTEVLHTTFIAYLELGTFLSLALSS